MCDLCQSHTKLMQPIWRFLFGNCDSQNRNSLPKKEIHNCDAIMAIFEPPGGARGPHGHYKSYSKCDGTIPLPFSIPGGRHGPIGHLSCPFLSFWCHSGAMPEPIPPKYTPNMTHFANLIHTWTHARPLPGIEPDTSRFSGGEEQQTYDTTLKCMHGILT